MHLTQGGVSGLCSRSGSELKTTEPVLAHKLELATDVILDLPAVPVGIPLNIKTSLDKTPLCIDQRD